MDKIKDLFHWYESTVSFLTHKKLGLIPLDSIAFIGQTGQLYVQEQLIGVSTEEFECLKLAVTRIQKILGDDGTGETLDKLQTIISFLEGYTKDDKLKDILNKFKKDLEDKVDKVEGKGLSTNDFTNELKDKLEELEPIEDNELNNILI